MITFFGILFVLLSINALLLIFSVNGAKEMFKKPFQKLSETKTPRIITQEYLDGEYKEAV